MYIITGSLKGRRLEMPIDKEIRPTPGKVKEALFSMIGHDLQGMIVLDLFSGTGNLGIEAISRGAEKVYFGEKSKSAYKLILKNIVNCKITDGYKVIAGDWEYVLSKISETLDIIFLDPPYEAGLMEDCIVKIWENNLLNDEGVIVAEHDKKELLPETIGGFNKIKDKKYGNTIITLYAKATEEINQ